MSDLNGGDEGKGKIVDWLSEQADVVIRFQGGHNAGHTLVIDESLINFDYFHLNIRKLIKISIIGNGVVVDPWALIEKLGKFNQKALKLTLKIL